MDGQGVARRAVEANRLAVRNRNLLTGVERTFGADEVIVSKTDLKGLITYANDVFQRVGGYAEDELIGAPHSILRHPDMPRCVFKFLWDRISAGHEVFAYVLNRAKNGDHYWVHAHVTPSYGPDGTLAGYHSNRRLPERAAIDKVRPLYASLLAAERAEASPAAGLERGMAALAGFVRGTGMEYDELVFTL